MNTSPGTDMRLLNALESGAAYIEGNPAEDDDIELFYYRFVSLANYTQGLHSSVVWRNSSPPRDKSNITQTPEARGLDKRGASTTIRSKPTKSPTFHHPC